MRWPRRVSNNDIWPLQLSTPPGATSSRTREGCRERSIRWMGGGRRPPWRPRRTECNQYEYQDSAARYQTGKERYVSQRHYKRYRENRCEGQPVSRHDPIGETEQKADHNSDDEHPRNAHGRQSIRCPETGVGVEPAPTDEIGPYDDSQWLVVGVINDQINNVRVGPIGERKT